MSDYSNNPLTYIPAKYKRPVYFTYSLAGLVLGAWGLADDAAWLAKALAIFAFVGLAIGATAGSNVTEAKSSPN